MDKSNAKKILNLQKGIIGFCALATLYNLSVIVIGACTKDSKATAMGIGGSLMTGCGLAMAVNNYLNNPHR